MVSAKLSTPKSVRMTRRTKSVHKPEVVQESQFEEVERAEIKSDVSDGLETQITRNETAAVHSTAQSTAEAQADGDVSETESNCSTVSAFQTPLFVRVTRRRQIVVPYQPDSPEKRRHDKSAYLNKLSKILDEDDVSEAESCSSAVSGAQLPNVTRTTRSRQSKKKLQPDTVCEAQSEGISDAESCCSHIEPSITTKRITRSKQMKSQAENTKQPEKGNRIVSEDENLIEDTVKSEPVIISDSRPAAELVSDMEDASSVTENNKESNSPKSKCSSKSANTTWSEDTKELDLTEMTPISLTKMRRSDIELPGIKGKKQPQSVGADDSAEAFGQMQAPNKILVRKGQLECMDLSLSDCMSPKQFLESQGQIPPNESKKNRECKRADAEADTQQSFTHADKLRRGEQASAVSSPQKDPAVARRTDGAGKCRVSAISVDSGEDQAGKYDESASLSSEGSSSGNDTTALFLNKHGSDESENSDAADVDRAEESQCYKKADERTPSLNKPLKNSSLHAEGLFVIDTKPGISSSQKYYLDQADQDGDAETKDEGSEKGEESSDLEEAEDELIDEDEKDEDDDLLKNKIDV